MIKTATKLDIRTETTTKGSHEPQSPAMTQNDLRQDNSATSERYTSCSFSKQMNFSAPDPTGSNPEGDF